jgi:UDP-N-acetylmuramoylalanine--D-glutamate ligase
MNITELNGKKICIVGSGREGQAMVRALKIYAPQADITVASRKQDLKMEAVSLQLGTGYLTNLDRFDVVIRSPGAPDMPEFAALAPSKVTNATVIFFDSIADTGVRTVGVTGTKGKSTTSYLIYQALKAKDERTFWMGNIGVPMIDFLGEAKPNTTFVIELSSYMLEFLRRSPHIAVVTSFFPEHLDRHKTIERYWQAKRNIASHQTKEDLVFYCADYPECRDIANSSPGTKIAYTAADFPLDIAQTTLKGEHNRSNLAAAFKVATYLGVPEKTALDALKNTQGLPYRLHSLGTKDGIEWVEDSLATAPEATLFALEALGNDIDTLITGGMDRGGYDFTAMGAWIAASRIRNVVLFPETGAHIKTAIENADPRLPKNYLETSSMKEAVEFARAQTKKGSICLLSSASPSYNLFKDYEDKAAQFEAAIGL